MMVCAGWVVGTEEPVEAEAVRIEAMPNQAKDPSNNREPREEQATRLSTIKNRQRNETRTEDNCSANKGWQVDYPRRGYHARNPKAADNQAKDASNNREPRNNQANAL